MGSSGRSPPRHTAATGESSTDAYQGQQCTEFGGYGGGHGGQGEGLRDHATAHDTPRTNNRLQMINYPKIILW